MEKKPKDSLKVSHKKELTMIEQLDHNNAMLVDIKAKVINLGERLIAKDQELSLLTEKYNKLDELKKATQAANHLSMLDREDLQSKYSKLKEAFANLLRFYNAGLRMRDITETEIETLNYKWNKQAGLTED